MKCPHPICVLFAAFGLNLDAQSVTAAKQMPRFADYRVSDVFGGKPFAPRFLTPEQRHWRSQIGDFGLTPNFAGHYAVVEWPCGTECMALAVVDAKTGTIYPPPLHNSKWPFALPIAQTDFEYPEYQLNSRLFVLKNACPAGLEKDCHTYYFVWNGAIFREVGRTRVNVPKSIRLRPWNAR